MNASEIGQVLSALPVLRCAFQLRAEESVSLPPFVGSMLRGAFGRALKNVVCRVPHGDCRRCWFVEACAYPYIFETGVLDDDALPRLHPQLYHNADVPHPFVLSAPPLIPLAREKRHEYRLKEKQSPNLNEFFARHELRAGDELSFGLTLIGRAVQLWHFALVAVRLMADDGLGEENAPFTLTHAAVFDEHDQMQFIFSEDAPRLRAAKVEPRVLHTFVEARLKQIEMKDSVRLRFFSPLRIASNGQLQTQVEFKTLIAKLTQRIEHLNALYAAPPCRFDLRELAARAASVTATDARWEKLVWEQHSNRQGQMTARHVLCGEAEYAGENVHEFLPILAAGEFLNVGKSTNYGLGVFRMVE